MSGNQQVAIFAFICICLSTFGKADYQAYFKAVSRSRLETSEIYDTGASVAVHCVPEIIRFCDRSMCARQDDSIVLFMDSHSSSSSESYENDGYMGCLYGCCRGVLKLGVKPKDLPTGNIKKPYNTTKGNDITTVIIPESPAKDECKKTVCVQERAKFANTTAHRGKDRARRSNSFRSYRLCMLPCVAYLSTVNSTRIVRKPLQKQSVPIPKPVRRRT